MEREIYLPLTNDFLFCEVMRNPAICKRFLEKLLEKSIVTIEYLNKQEDLTKDYLEHGLRLDIYVEDDAGNRYNIEMQKVRHRDEGYRVRYAQSGMDHRILEKGGEYGTMPDTCVIFICDFDPFGLRRAQYLFRMRDGETPSLTLEDGRYAYFLNTKYKEANASEEILYFLDALREGGYAPAKGDLANMAVKLANEIRSDERRIKMYTTVETRMKEERRIGREEGREEGRIGTLCELVYSDALPFPIAARKSGLPKDQFLQRMKELYPDWSEE